MLKTDAAESLVSLHPDLVGVFDGLPVEGPLFPDLNVNQVTKRFTRLWDWVMLDGLVFHSTRKLFITQAEGAIFQYINGFHYPRRRHSSLGGKSPLAFERKAA